MTEYTNEELMNMCNDLRSVITHQSSTIRHLREVIQCYIKDEQRIQEKLQQLLQPDANGEDLVYRLNKRAEIRRQIPTRKSVQEGAPDRLSDLLEEAASALSSIRDLIDDI